jgi:hypothetical protein
MKSVACGPRFFYMNGGNGPLPAKHRGLPVPPATPRYLEWHFYDRKGNGPLPENPRGLPVAPAPPVAP